MNYTNSKFVYKLVTKGKKTEHMLQSCISLCVSQVGVQEKFYIHFGTEI
jgi:hypothetical protein